MTTDNSSVSTRRWGGVALGLVFLALGVIPGVFSGWRTTDFVLAIGGFVIAVSNLAWIMWPRRRRSGEEPH